MTLGSDTTPPPAVPDSAPPDSAAPDSAAPDEDDAEESARVAPPGAEAVDAVSKVLSIVGTIVAPTTFVTALLFYFGLLYGVGYYRYFGVNWTVLAVPVQGYLILSASTATLPLAVLAVSTLVGLWLYRLPVHPHGTRRRAAPWRNLVPAVGALGVALLASVLTDVLFDVRVYGDEFWEARGLCLTGGVLTLAYAARLRRSLAAAPRRGPAVPRPHQAEVVAKWGSILTLAGVGLFWAIGSYAIRVGARDAEGLAGDMACTPDVTLYSERDLGLGASGVTVGRTGDADAAFRFRHTGLKIVPQAGEQYLLLPADWAPSARPAILLPREGVRLEFSWAPGHDPLRC